MSLYFFKNFFILPILLFTSVFGKDLEGKHDFESILDGVQTQYYLPTHTQFNKENVFHAIEIPSIEEFDYYLVGQTNKTLLSKNYDYYRYITYYNIEQIYTAIVGVPNFFEECFEEGVFASFEKTISWRIFLITGIPYSQLGLNAGLDKTHLITFSRNVIATKNLMAEHEPLMLSEKWQGKIFLQTFKISDMKVELHALKPDKSYFEMLGNNPKLIVKRNILSICN